MKSQLTRLSSSAPDVRLSLNMTLPPGTGPRHALFQVIDSHSSIMYLVSELDNTIHAFRVTKLHKVDVGEGNKSGSASTVHNSGASSTNSSTSLNVKLLQTASTLGAGDNRTELALSNDGRFLYVANRGTTSFASDTLTIFAVDGSLSSTSTPITYLGSSLTQGKIPRYFSLSKDAENSCVAVANEVINNILVFKRDFKTGFVDDSTVVGNLTIGKFDTSLSAGPMAVIWA
jgi:6-phosphogluconolactonase (cycloisomerase 2 family)